MTVHSRAGSHLAEVEKKLVRTDRLLASLPEGSASIFVSGGRVRGKYTVNGAVHYAGKADFAASPMRELLFKRYLRVKQAELSSARQYLRARIQYEQEYFGKAAAFLADHPLLANAIAPLLQTENASLQTWMSAPSSQQAPLQEKRTEPAPGGLLVRSKSEVMIASVLLERGLFFRYEEPLYLSGTLYYPDFTIRDARGCFYWYEHFGLMDNAAYAQRAFDKLGVYAANDILPCHNLITTYESGTHKLSLSQIHHALDAFFD